MSLLTPEEQKAAEKAEAYGSGFEALPAGTYPCYLTDLAPHTTGTSFFVRWKIIPEQKYAGRTFIDFPSRKPEYLGKIKSILLAVGGSIDSDPADLIGRVALVTVDEQYDNRPEHKGEKQNKVKYVKPYNGPDVPSYVDAVTDGDEDIDNAFGPPADSDEALI
jgi:hypothetical protein